MSKGESALLIPVLLILDRYEEGVDFVMDHNSIEDMHPCMKGLIIKGSVLCTDGSKVYSYVAKEEKLQHKQIFGDNPAHSLENGTFHIQTLNNYMSRLKGWITKFAGVGTAYLCNYLAWWRLIAQHRAGTRRSWLDEALSI